MNCLRLLEGDPLVRGSLRNFLGKVIFTRLSLRDVNLDIFCLGIYLNVGEGVGLLGVDLLMWLSGA